MIWWKIGAAILFFSISMWGCGDVGERVGSPTAPSMVPLPIDMGTTPIGPYYPCKPGLVCLR